MAFYFYVVWRFWVFNYICKEMVTIEGKEYDKQRIETIKSMLYIYKYEVRLCMQYVNKQITQKDIDYIGVRNFADAYEMISTHDVLINAYELIIEEYNKI